MADILLVDESQFPLVVKPLRAQLNNVIYRNIRGQQVNSFLTMLEALVRAQKQKIRFVVIVDHGALGKQQLGNGMLNLGAINAGNRALLQRLGRINCTRFYLLGCNLSHPVLNINTSVGKLVGKQIVASQATVLNSNMGSFSEKAWLRFETNGHHKKEPHQVCNGDLMNPLFQIKFAP